MLPDIDLRLQSITKTLQDIVLPAVPASETQACEQVMLIVSHLAILGSQWKFALKFELGTYDGLCDLARQLAAEANGLRGPLESALATSAILDRTDYDNVAREVKHLGGLLDQIISGNQTTAPMDRALFDAVLGYGHREAWRYRVWFAASQLDPDAADLPGFDALFK